MRKQILLAALLAACASVTTVFAASIPGSTTVGGTLYIDGTHISQNSNGASVDPTGTGFDIKRGYIVINHDFNNVWSANATTDFAYSSSAHNEDIYIKKAYLQGEFSKAFVLRIGEADMPWIPFVENLYGYRYVENTLTDRLKFANSADAGVNVNGAAGIGAAGIVNYSVSVVDGGGYHHLVRTKSVDWEGRIALEPIPGLTVAGGFYNGYLGQNTVSTPARNTYTRFDALVAWVGKGVRLGGEYFTENRQKQIDTVCGTATTPPCDSADGFDIWGSYDFAPQFSVFARFDHANLSKKINPGLKDTYYNFGVAYSPIKTVDLALAYKHESVDHGSWSTTNGTIGGINASTSGSYEEIGVWAQVKW